MANIVEMPKLGFDMAEGKLVRWVKAENDKVEKGDVLAEIETDKATVEVESAFSGILARHLASEASMVPVGTPIAVIVDEGETYSGDLPAGAPQSQPIEDAAVPAQTAPEPAVPAPAAGGLPGFLKASPLAKRIARDKGLDLAAVSGSGPGGRIVKRDLAAVQPAQAAPVTPAMPAPAPAQADLQSAPTRPAEPGEVVEASRLRQAIGRRMLESHQTIPVFTVTHTYNAQPLVNVRKEMNENAADTDKISVNDFFIRAAALALRQFPNLNASISGSQITRKAQVNIGVAIAVENGLLTIVVRDADRKPLSLISREMKEMSARVRDGKVRNEDVEGSTFTISNLGMFDVEQFTAIINPPEAAILAVGTAMQVPVVEDNALAVGWRVKATLSADHRITDGAEAARFMQQLALYLEKPWNLL